MTKRKLPKEVTDDTWPEWGHPGARDQRYSVGLWDPATVVRVARAYAGLSQRELADRTGLALSTISRLESARSSPRFSIVYQCIEICDLRIALIGTDAEVVTKAPLVLQRDAAGRHYPAHLKIYRVEKASQWWNGDGRQPRVVKLSECPPYSFRQWWGTRGLRHTRGARFDDT